MGGCAGGPQRKIHRGNLPNNKKPQDKVQNKYKVQQSMEKDNMRRSQINFGRGIFQVAKNKQTFETSTDSIKNKVLGKTVQKYAKPTTIREQEQSKENIFLGMSSMPKKTINEESLERSMEQRRNGMEEQDMRYNNHFFESPSEIKEVLPSSNVTAFEFDHSQESVHQFKTKKDQKDLQVIIEMFKDEAETPGYIRGMKKQNGQDIRMDNFDKFNAVPQLQWIQLHKYLDQIA